MRMNCSSAMSAARSLPSANERMPSASQYEASTGIASRTCSAAPPFMTAPSRVSTCHVPWPGVTTNAVPPSRCMPAWNEASVRSDGFRNSSPRILPGERGRLGSALQALREREQVHDFVAREIGQVEEALHEGIGDRG